MGESYTFGEALRLLHGLRSDTGSHIYASERGWAYAASVTDIATLLHTEWYMNVHRDRKLSPELIKLPRPWPEQVPNADVTEERRAELMAQLAKRSAIRD